MSPANKQSDSCQNILRSAEGLVRKKGFSATTVDEVCRCAGVTKGGFFHYFKSKDALGLEMLKRIDESFEKEQCCGSAPDLPEDSLERVMYAIDRMADAGMDPESKCCILGSFAQERCEIDSEIADLCQCICNKSMDRFKSVFQAAKDDYAPDSDIDVSALTETLFALRQGTAVMAKAQGDKQAIPRIFANYKVMVRSVFTNVA